ncbi:SulP family inorganic anion transporter [Vagococcus fluvialis]|uniref:SulP family inorganic anion transporter n=1 Tax=Vagococcus fluvialis TaxID=2738 RepID=UPI003D0E8AF3
MRRIFNQYSIKYLKNDLISGVIVAALSIPVAMGYAQVAGLPVEYGLYVSILPVITYALFASSPQLIFGVDSSSAAIAGSVVAMIGLENGSKDVINFISLFSLFTGLFMIIFSIAKLGRFMTYISEPVMSGTIFGISFSVMMSQIPQLLTIKSENAEFGNTIISVYKHFEEINYVSLMLGIVTIMIIITGKNFLPRIPFPLIVIVIATIFSYSFQFESIGVEIIGEIPKGLPSIFIPKVLSSKLVLSAIVGGFFSSILLTIDSLLTGKNFANKNNYIIDDNQEILAFGMSNIISSFSGILPTSASVSRTASNIQFKGKTQMTSIISAVIIILVLLFASRSLYFMPQPVLSGVVFSALFGVVIGEFKEFKLTITMSRVEGIIWITSVVTVLLFGALIGILSGIVLSFILVIVTNTRKSYAFLGESTDKKEKYYYDLSRNKDARPILGTIIFRFSHSLFFTNIDIFIDKIEGKITEDTTKIIIDAHAMTTIDLTAARKLKKFLEGLKAKKIDYYFVNTIGDFRDDILEKGLQEEIGASVLLVSIEEALSRQ